MCCQWRMWSSLPWITREGVGGATDPDAEVVALQPEDLLATGRYICEVCGKGFQRDQNLQLHMRTHNINWELKKSGGTPARRKAYICPVPTCVYNDRSRALSDITGIKKHFNRKHGTKNLICPQCSKPYAVEADLKAHLKNHILRDHQCECGSTFSR
ncbi:zinc finger protein NUTCRACKER-like [Musa acuminata AAA Group]|uniref:zinc finger protein NUTCRACKER-like n=1 Tax=Musa acuminata AAA Group TaxID=214697 RepID=UPI0031D52074